MPKGDAVSYVDAVNIPAPQGFTDLESSLNKKITDEKYAAFDTGFKRGWEMARHPAFKDMTIEQFHEWAKVMLEYGYSGGKYE